MSNGNDETQFGGGGDATRVGGTPAASSGDGDDKRKLWLIALAVLLIGILIGVGIAVAGGGDGKKKAGDGSSTSSSSTSTSTSTSTTSTTLAPTTTTTQAPNPSDDPKVDSVSANPGSTTCANVSDPKSVTVSWSTSNATQVVLSVDGPGIYGTYPGGNGSQSLGLGCPSPGTSEQHTYTVTAKGPNGPDAVKSITYSVNTIP